MASEAQIPEQLSSAFERLLRHRDLSLFLPFILGFTATTTQNPDQENQETTSEQQHERIILINPFTQGMVVIEGTSSLDSLLRDLASKNGHPPASKASIESLPSVDIKEIGDQDSECAICLEEYGVVVVKEMPCKHRFHGNCIDKWLGIHGSCPVCRYKMPVDDEELGKKRDHEEGEGGGSERRRVDREIWVSFSFNTISNNRRNQDSNQTPSTDSNDVNSNSSPSLDQGREV